MHAEMTSDHIEGIEDLSPAYHRGRNETSSRSKSRSHRHSVSKKHMATEMESSLVTHIRKTIPLESLKELSGEIGFTSEDIESVSLQKNIDR